MDPYRDATIACPSCGTRLRGLDERLICDACGGMLLPVVDFAASTVDLGASRVDVVAGESVARACPRCGGVLTTATLEVDRRRLKTRVTACMHHGLWFDGGALERAATEISRRTSRGRGRAIADEATGGWWRYPLPKARSASLVAREPAFRPRVRTPFASALADRSLACPTCHGRLQLRGMLWTCDDHGVFVEHDVLAAMVAEMMNAPWDPPPWTGALDVAGARACPACAESLATGELAGATVERCAAHGLWFAPGELENALGRLGKPAHKTWLGRWLS